MIAEYRTVAWWYWLTTLLLLGTFLAGWDTGLVCAMAVTVVHGWYILLAGHALVSVPCQVRAAYLLLLVAGAWSPLAFVHWAMLAGTTARILFAYCFLARTLALMPWNRREPVSWRAILRTYLTPPTRGSILDSLGCISAKLQRGQR